MIVYKRRHAWLAMGEHAVHSTLWQVIGRDAMFVHLIGPVKNARGDVHDAHLTIPCATFDAEWEGIMLDDITALTDELVRARAKFPGNRFLLPALVEEVGELAGAYLTGRSPEEIKQEAIQVACLAMRIATETDAAFDRMITAPLALTRVVRDLGETVRAFLQKRDFHNQSGALLASTKHLAERGDPAFDDLTEDEAKP